MSSSRKPEPGTLADFRRGQGVKVSELRTLTSVRQSCRMFRRVALAACGEALDAIARLLSAAAVVVAKGARAMREIA